MEASLKLAGNFDSDKLNKVAMGQRKNLPGHRWRMSERGSQGGHNRKSEFPVAPQVPEDGWKHRSAC